MRIGIAPLVIAIAVATAHQVGATVAADLLACLYLTVATVNMTRNGQLKATQRI